MLWDPISELVNPAITMIAAFTLLTLVVMTRSRDR